MTPLQLAAVAAATGIGWGVVMALVAWLRDGTEIVLMQAWILVPAWLFGRAAGSPRSGALAGFALVTGAVYAYELLPGWGLDVMLRREVVRPEERDLIAGVLDREDIALFSTLAIGALVGLGGGLRTGPAVSGEPEPPAQPVPAAEPPRSPPPPLWARLEQAPRAVPAPFEPPAEPPPAEGSAGAPSPTPWGAAFLAAAVATDVLLERLFDMYTDVQGAVAVGFLVAGAAAVVWIARRYAVAMLLAGAVLAAAFAAVQHAEYESRAPDGHHAAER